MLERLLGLLHLRDGAERLLLHRGELAGGEGGEPGGEVLGLSGIKRRGDAGQVALKIGGRTPKKVGAFVDLKLFLTLRPEREGQLSVGLGLGGVHHLQHFFLLGFQTCGECGSGDVDRGSFAFDQERPQLW